MTRPTARDGLDVALAEKLWTLIPQSTRDADAGGDSPGALRALVEVIAGQAAHLRRSHDRLWDDQMIELCADWAVPYIGALLATRSPPVLARRGRRVDVARTIFYRRRKGTPAVLEQLASDITGWDAALSEGFRRLARMPHPLDAPRDAAAWAAVAGMDDPLALARLGGPFDRLQHLPDIAAGGRFGIHRMTVHLYRLRGAVMRNVVPRAHAGVPDSYTFDPSGRDVPLFARRGRTDAGGDALDPDGWRPAAPWDVAAPIACRLLGHEVFRITPAVQAGLRAFGLTAPQVAELAALLGRSLPGPERLRTALLGRPSAAVFLAPAALAEIRRLALVADCGKARLIPRSIRVEAAGAPLADLPGIASASLANWADPRPTAALVIDPERGRLRVPAGTPAARLRTDHILGQPMALGATALRIPGRLPPPDAQRAEGAGIAAVHLPRIGTLRLTGNATWGQPSNRLGIRDMAIHAAAGDRPYLRLVGPWRLVAAPVGNARLHLDGLWIGAGAAAAALDLEGDWETVRLTHVTLDPGGALTEDAPAPVLPPLALRVLGRVQALHLDRAILGPLRLAAGGRIDAIHAADSILDDPAGLVPLSDTDIHLDRCTVTGGVGGRRAFVSNTLIRGLLAPRDRQAGCFRFSAARTGSTPPPRHRAALLPAGVSPFAARRFGNPDYLRLRAHAPEVLRTGGEDGQEMGVFHGLGDAARLAALHAKMSEYAPFGLLPIPQFET
ncbi:MAG: hypothetical protein ACXIU8_13810 [Alkalilacustris sp.]